MIPSEKEWKKILTDRHGEDFQNRISNLTVAICGLGGLGSNIAVILARVGISSLVLIDFDTVDLSNIHRQQYKLKQIGIKKTEALSENLKEINPYLKIRTHPVRLDEHNASELLINTDIICEAFDNPEDKALLTNFVLENMADKYLVAASGMAGLDSANSIKTRKVSNRFYLCGDEKSDAGDGIGLVASRVAVCASHQAHMVIRIISENFEE